VVLVEEVEEDAAVDVVEADVDAVAEEDEVEDATRIKTTLSLTKKQLTTTTITLWRRIQTPSHLKMVRRRLHPAAEADEEKLPMVAAGEEKEGLLEGVVDPLEEKDVAEVDADVVEKEDVKREAVEREVVVVEEERIADRIVPRLWMSRTQKSTRKATSTTIIIWKERSLITMPTRIRTLPRRNTSSLRRKISSLPLKRKRLSQSIIHPPSPCRQLLQPSLSKHAVECQ
jgi:hypothetical protein